MKPTFFAGLALLILFVAACSQAPVNSPEAVEPQFGGATFDSAQHVVTNPRHPYVYVAGKYDPHTPFLRRFERDGRLAWEHRLRNPLNKSAPLDPAGFGTDASGNTYLAYLNLGAPATFSYLTKFDKTGKRLWQLDLGSDALIMTEALTVDDVGNTYVALADYKYDGDWGDYLREGTRLRKYSPTGRLLWERAPTRSPYFYDLAVTDDALFAVVYGSGSQFTLNRYGLGGKLLCVRETSVQNLLIATGGGAVYTAGRANLGSNESDILLSKYDEAGVQVWRRTIKVSGPTSFMDLQADSQSNVYATGTVLATGRDDLFVRKYNASGSTVWNYQPKLPGTDEFAWSLAVRSSGELYVSGATDGKVNSENFGLWDAFVVRLDGQGKRVWSR